MYSPNPYGQMQPMTTAGALGGAVAYLRKVYALFAGGIGVAILGGLAALYVGQPTVVGETGGVTVAVPPMIGFAMEHTFIMFAIFIAAFFGAKLARQTPGLNVAALFGFSFVTGVVVAPLVFIALLLSAAGQTLDPSPVRDAFLLTGAAFTGLTGYVFVTKKDFSYMGASLSIGLWVLIGASILGLFFHAAVLQLAMASVGVLLFSGYILYDTSRILQDREERDAVGAALRLFLDVVNLFQDLLIILMSNRRER